MNTAAAARIATFAIAAIAAGAAVVCVADTTGTAAANLAASAAGAAGAANAESRRRSAEASIAVACASSAMFGRYGARLLRGGGRRRAVLDRLAAAAGALDGAVRRRVDGLELPPIDTNATF